MFLMSSRRVVVITIIVFSALAVSSAQRQSSPSLGAFLDNLKFREIGPADMGGRIDDFAVVESQPSIIYVATASAGVWKSINGGTTWEPLFDKEEVSTIGDVTLAPSDPSIVWAGSGEANNRQSSSWGNGVYKSTDAGRTWTNVGLKETHHIARIEIHPADPNTVYVAAAGRLWGPSKERGVYKTTDGGRSWTQALAINDDTGVIDIAMDPQSPGTVYAAAYQRRRSAFGFNGSGPHSALYKTTDGGASWKKLTKGLPEGGETGRIGLSIYKRNPNIVYAIIEHARGGVFRSEDKGESWTRMSDVNPRPMYYSQVRIDPNNDQRIWALGAPMYYSEDGGKTFRTNLVQRIHGDHHAMWINPANSDHMLVGSDGGIHVSYDRGRTWDYVNTIALAQFYEVGVDMKKPYNVCGGLQDNGSWCGPSQSLLTHGITNEDWYRVGGGDGFYVQVDSNDANTVYAESQDGNLFRRDLRTGESRSIRPEPKEGEARYRFQWNSPVVISGHDSRTIYYGGNILFKSANRGDQWTKLGGDLTTGIDRNKQPIMGKVPDRETLSRHDGVQAFPCITTVSESPVNPAVLWAGTDDGNLQVTRNGGESWKNVAGLVPGVPKGTYVSRVIASHHGAGTAYVTFDGHRGNDFNVYIFRTADYGETWTPISEGIPRNNGVVNVIREHHRNANLLFAGAEYGAYVSFDRGGYWHRLKGNLPTVPVDDIAIHPRDNDLILGTHGRSIWLLDDITPLEQMSEKITAADLHLFAVRPAVSWRLSATGGSTGHKLFLAENPPYGALIHYWFKSKLDEKEKIKITISDPAGKTVREIDGPTTAGFHRVSWDLRYGPPAEPTEEEREQIGRFGFGGPRGPMVEPGEYGVKITAAGRQAAGKLTVEEDPRIQISSGDRAARRKALDDLYDLYKTADAGRRSVTRLRAQVTSTTEGWKKSGGGKIPESVEKAAEEMAKQVREVYDRFVSARQGLGAAGPPLTYTPPPFAQRIGRLMSAIEGYTAAPTPQQVEEIAAIRPALTDSMDRLKRLVETDLPRLNKMMNDAGIPHIAAGGAR